MSRTDLLSHDDFIAKLKLETERLKRYNRPLAMIVFAIDGQEAGDTLLAGLGALIRAELRDCDEVGRYAGERVAVLLPEQTAEQARAVARRLCKKIMRKPVEIPGRDGKVSIALLAGVAGFEDELDLEIENIAAAVERDFETSKP